MSSTAGSTNAFWTVDDVDIDQLRETLDATTRPEHYRNAVEANDAAVLYDLGDGAIDRTAMRSEIAHALGDGPGIVVMRGAVDAAVLGRATEAFEAIINAERRSERGAGDHFAAPGANDRVWNALEKLAVAEPGVFVEYYANEAVELAAMAWLGPGYQVTSQINVVSPGGAAQAPHRDYHLGFMSDDHASRFPAEAHRMSSGLTLQGAIAHCDMPIASGPTMFLPHSHKYPRGYLAWRRRDVMELFESRYQQLPLSAGDAVFFNPAVFHAAGSNHTSDVRRMANLLQISSPFGRAMEVVDRTRVVRAVVAELQRVAPRWSAAAVERVVAVTADGYPFPTNLDFDPPIAGSAPPSQADLVREAIVDQWPVEVLTEKLHAHARLRRSH
ncbi:MAG: phytanoyl-CoA dioxygenase family protein [Actinomycetota bacterium]